MRATQPRPYGWASSAWGARRSSGFSSSRFPRTGEPTATVRPERPCTVASVSPTSTRSTAQNSTSGVYQSTSPSGAVTPTVTMPSSICAHTCRPARYCLSEGSAKRADGAVAVAEISPTSRASRLPWTERPLHRRDDPPGRVVGPVERERPALREAGRAVPGAAEDGRGVAVLHIAAAAQLDLDGHRGGHPLDLHRRDLDALHARPAHNQAGLAARVARVEERAYRLLRCGPLELGVVAVHRLGPRPHRAAGGGLEHVGREAAVGDREVERTRPRVALELDLGEVRG